MANRSESGGSERAPLTGYPPGLHLDREGRGDAGMTVRLTVSYKTLLLIFVIFDVFRRILEVVDSWVKDII